jgi:zinc/manganese transport system ATP-binding protein
MRSSRGTLVRQPVDLGALAREAVAWGPTEGVLTSANAFRARQMAEAWPEHAETCDRAA